jgi:hypothetical protein
MFLYNVCSKYVYPFKDVESYLRETHECLPPLFLSDFNQKLEILLKRLNTIVHEHPFSASRDATRGMRIDRHTDLTKLTGPFFKLNATAKICFICLRNDHSGYADEGLKCLRPLKYRDRGFESLLRH